LPDAVSTSGGFVETNIDEMIQTDDLVVVERLEVAAGIAADVIEQV
jgi:hypothetical protein